MALYSNDVINEVFSQNDIVDYISQYVVLKKSGRDYSGLCPFHKEKSPSFHVSREKQLFHCFGCGASGNLVQFVMRTEGIDFVEAIKLLADRVGIVLPEENNTVNFAAHEKKKKILEMNKAAARFFYTELTTTQKGKEALEYFKNRGLSQKTITSYGLGYAPDEYGRLHVHMNELGYTDEELIDAGLVSVREDKVYDRFRNRVMFPIIDLRGNIIGFGGRIMVNAVEVNGYKPPKYLNSAETPVFNKGRNLFSLNFAKKDNSGKLILVEGYMDVISVYQAGIQNVVATLGTALTEDQAKLMLKYSNEILICYDSDEAGQKAAIRAVEIINGVGGKSKVIKLKGAKDPDEYIKQNGVELFKKAISDAVPSTEFRLVSAKSKYNLDITDGKIEFLSEAADILSGISDAVEVDAYIKKISAETEISTEAIYSEYKKRVKKSVLKKPNQPLKTINSQGGEEKKNAPAVLGNSLNAIENAEKRLLNLISQNKKLCQKIIGELTPDDFSNQIYKKLAQMIYQAVDDKNEIEPAMLLNEFEGEELKIASSVFYNLEIYDSDEKTFDELILTIKREKIKQEILNEKDPSRLRELLLQQAMLCKKIK